jgi:NADH dehydrogenase FAD-containing subunit
MDVDEHDLDYLAQAHWHHFRFRYGEMVGLDRARKEVILAPTVDEEGREITPRRSFGYDTLVIAVGSVVNDFGTPGVQEHAIALDQTQQAARFNRRLVNACIRAHAQEGPVRPGQLDVAIIGAGATGTELAAELHRTTRAVVAYGLDRVDPEKDIHITLIEAADRILPGLPPRISEAAHGLLRNLGVEVRTGARVSAVRADGVQLADGGFIPSELVVWAAGVKGPDVLKDLDLELSRSNQLVVLPTLQTTRDPDVFAIGDCAWCPREGHPAPVPPRAQAAHQQASHMTGRSAASCGAARWSPSSTRTSARWSLRGVLGGGQPDGLPGGEEHDDRGLLRQDDVPLALQDARTGAARHRVDGAQLDRAGPDAAHRPAREAALRAPGVPRTLSGGSAGRLSRTLLHWPGRSLVRRSRLESLDSGAGAVANRPPEVFSW